MSWEKDEVMRLIEGYREERCLWDVQIPAYKDRQKKGDAWRLLGNLVNRDWVEVERKMKSLIGQFQREMKKIKGRSGQGADDEDDVSIPGQSKWFAFESLLFLQDKSKPHSTSNLGIQELRQFSSMDQPMYVECGSRKNRGVFFFQGFTYVHQKTLKSGPDRYVCSSKKKFWCNAYLKVVDKSAVELDTNHNHDAETDQDFCELRADVKKRTNEGTSSSPSDIVRSVLRERKTIVDAGLVDRLKQTAYRTKRRMLPTLPTSCAEVFINLSNMPIQTTMNEQFLLHRDAADDALLCDSVFKLVSYSKDDCGPSKIKKSKSPETTGALVQLAARRLQEPEDDCDKVAAAWAVELRQMDPLQQLFAKKAINDILFEGQMGTLHRESVKINVSLDQTTP